MNKIKKALTIMGVGGFIGGVILGSVLTYVCTH